MSDPQVSGMEVFIGLQREVQRRNDLSVRDWFLHMLHSDWQFLGNRSNRTVMGTEVNWKLSGQLTGKYIAGGGYVFCYSTLH